MNPNSGNGSSNPVPGGAPPSTQLNNSPNNLMQDIAVAPKSPNQELIKAEIENNIPVKQPSSGASSPQPQTNNPILSKKPNAQNDAEKDDAELDNILKNVNHDIKTNKSYADGKQVDKSKKTEVKKEKKNQKPILLTVAAFLVGVSLSGAAVYAFMQNETEATKQPSNVPGKVGTRAESSDAVQAAGGTLVTPSDLADLSESLNSKINALNDAEDFKAEDLSDTKLGL